MAKGASSYIMGFHNFNHKVLTRRIQAPDYGVMGPLTVKNKKR
jgi:hypothetical protein